MLILKREKCSWKQKKTLLNMPSTTNHKRRLFPPSLSLVSNCIFCLNLFCVLFKRQKWWYDKKLQIYVSKKWKTGKKGEKEKLGLNMSGQWPWHPITAQSSLRWNIPLLRPDRRTIKKTCKYEYTFIKTM